jgi:hypothetical protein
MWAVDGAPASHALPGSIQLGSDEQEPSSPAAVVAKTTAMPVLVSTQ